MGNDTMDLAQLASLLRRDQRELSKLANRGQLPGRKVHLKIEEIKTPETDARLIAESIGEQITRRVSYRRAMKHAATQAMLDAPGNDARRQLGIERARSFTWERAAQQTVEAYEMALGVRLIGPALEEYPGRRQDEDLQVER